MILTAPKLSSSSPRKVPFEPFSVLKIISMNAENNAVSNYLSFLKFFLHFWLFPYIFLSSPGCFTLKSWVFWVHSNYVFRSPKKLKISVFSIQVHWENCKLTTKNARKTEENIRLLTAFFFRIHRKYFADGKWLEKNNFSENSGAPQCRIKIIEIFCRPCQRFWYNNI